MIFQTARFINSCYDLAALPPDDGTEVIFLGRSNVGKSSLLNALCGRRLLARTSKTPGRTQCLNVFEISATARLVDAPGYGFAKVPETVKKQWQSLVMRYCQTRESLRLIVLVMDIRHPLQPADREWLDLLGGSAVTLAIVMNKSDCLGRMQQRKSHDLVEKYCRDALMPVNLFRSSSRSGKGIDELRLFIQSQLD